MASSNAGYRQKPLVAALRAHEVLPGAHVL